MSKFRATYSGGSHLIADEGYTLQDAICGVIRMNITNGWKYNLTLPLCWKFEKLVETPTWEEIVID